MANQVVEPAPFARRLGVVALLLAAALGVFGGPAAVVFAQDGSGAEAAAAYRRLVEGPPRRPEAYIAAYTPNLECFYGRRDVARATLRGRALAAPAVIAELLVVEEGADVVTLVDRGWYGGDGQLAFHEKVVRLRKVEQRWLVSAETGVRARGCLTEVLQRAPRRSWRLSHCERAIRPAVRAMVNRCDQPDDVHGCAYYSEEAQSLVRECFFGRTVDLAIAPTGMAGVRDVPWSQLRYFYRTAWSEEDHASFQGVTFRDVDGDRRDDAVVTLGLQDNPPVHAYAVRRGHVVELGEVAAPEDPRCAASSSRRDPRIVCAAAR